MGVIALLGIHHSQAADHLDSPGPDANPMADIGDVFAWMTTDGAKVNLAMTVSPADDGTRHFGNTVQYAFHISSRPGLDMAGMESKVICTFTSDTAGKCWVIDPAGKTLDYVEGDLSGVAGKASASGKFRAFAGRRSDPFFFNLGGFLKAVGFVKANIAALAASENAQGCPDTTAAAATLRSDLQTAVTAQTGPCAANQIDCFLNFNVMSIVLQVDKDELLKGSDKLLSVWGSTHTGS